MAAIVAATKWRNRKEIWIMTRKALEKLNEAMRNTIEQFREEYKSGNKNETRQKAKAYITALQHCGLLTIYEAKEVFIYTTV